MTVDDVEVGRLLESKGILAGREIVLYGYRPDDVQEFRTNLSERGISARIYESGWEAWSADPALPVERLVNYQRLVHPQWLRQVLGGGHPEATPRKPFMFRRPLRSRSLRRRGYARRYSPDR